MEHEPGEAVERELMLVKVRAEGEARAARPGDLRRVPRARARRHAPDHHDRGHGLAPQARALLALLQDFGVVELSRTGRIALARGDRGIRERGARQKSAAAGMEEWTGGGV